MPRKKKNTPSRQQYLDIKANFPHAIVFYRLGDFYETFDDDAELVARELDLTLTARKVSKGQKVPMAGVPHHAAENYIAKLVDRGYHVAIADQIGTEPVDGLMQREVTQVVTPGTVTSPNMLDDRQNNFLMAIMPDFEYERDDWQKVGLAYVDITTGEFAATEFHGDSAAMSVFEELSRISPREVLLPQTWVDRGVSFPAESHVTPQADFRFDVTASETALTRQFEVKNLQAYGLVDNQLAMRAAGAIVQYLQETQPSALDLLRNIYTYSTSGYMSLDIATRRNLELTQTLSGKSSKGSLLEVVDRTTTSMGSRLLRNWIGQPLVDSDRINARLNAVQTFYKDGTLRAEMLDILRSVADIERLTNRIMMGKAGPKAVRSLGETLAIIPEIRDLIGTQPALEALVKRLNPLPSVVEEIEAALVDEPPALMNQVGVFRGGYSDELDAIHATAADAKDYVANLESQERERTGIKSLKVGYNKVFGYYLEVTKANTDAVPEEYIRKQTLVNAERYITPQLKDYETIILNADEQGLEVEQRLFNKLCAFISKHNSSLLEIARSIAHLDVFAGLAEVAAREGYIRPQLVEDDVIDIHEGRHPVVEKFLRGERFVPNDAYFDGQRRIKLITGPNMAGKSVYMRQVALIVLMAQIGSFVPATEAILRPVDRIFARVGAQDEIHAGQSTFMVEMTETAAILAHATPHSLVILDEIGRGTSTYDGMSIARAVIEYIHNTPRLGCKTLFATHYHELTELEAILPKVFNYNVAVAEDGEHVVFLHRVVEGKADRSYGIYVAKLAGVPKGVVNRANEILQDLEAQGSDFTMKRDEKENQYQLSLFDDSRHPAIKALQKLEIDNMSPIDAITRLYELKLMAEDEN